MPTQTSFLVGSDAALDAAIRSIDQGGTDAATGTAYTITHRVLLLSPDHAVLVDGALIPIRHLINGTTIARVPVDEVTYYHLELPRHEVLLAEGLPAESYLDTGNASNFSNRDGPVALHPDFASFMWEAESCAPLIVTGPKLEAAKRRVNARG